jgi:hypothetical protein
MYEGPCLGHTVGQWEQSMTKSEAQPEAKPAVILVGADRGGVGKTTVTRTLLDYYAAKKVPIRAYDTEAPRGTLTRFHPDVTEIVDMTSIPDQMRIFDTLKPSDMTLIDIRAGLLSSTLSGLQDIGFIEAARKGQTTQRTLTGIPQLTRPTSKN